MKPGMGIRKVLLAGVAVVTCLGSATLATAPAPAPAPARTAMPQLRGAGSFSGTIAVHGCTVTPEDLMVRARRVSPRNPVAPGGLRQPDDARVGSQVVRVRATAPGQFEFSFQGLIPFTPYRVGVKLMGRSARRCDQVVWDASRDPLVLADSEPLAFDAYVVNSRLAIWGAAQEGRSRAAWVAADFVDFDDPTTAMRRFRWRSVDPDVAEGRLQVSTAPFPRVGSRAFNPCSADPTAVVYQQDFTSEPGAWAIVPVDFEAIVGGGGRTDLPGAGLDPDDGDTGPGPVIDDNMRTRLELGRPLYVRVLPMPCDPERGVPAEVLVAKPPKKKNQAPPPEGPVFAITEIIYAQPFIGARPKAGETCYRVTEDHYVVPPTPGSFGTVWDMMVDAHMSGVSYGQTASSTFPNNMFCVPAASDDDGWLESFTNTVGAVLTGLVDEIAKLVNSASELWEQIQDYAVQAVAAGLNVIPGVNCPPTPCQAALEMGLEVALATMGVPPSIPNFDQLMDQGFDYAAAQLASQVGVPSVIADVASDEAQKFIKQAVQDMQGRPYSIPKLPPWLVPDIRFNPAVLTLRIQRTTELFDTLPSRPTLIRDSDPIYHGRSVQLPTKLPPPSAAMGLAFPMVLEPNLTNLPAPPAKCSAQQRAAYVTLFGPSAAAALCDITEYEAAVWDKNKWVSLRYKNGCYHLVLTGLAPVLDPIFVLSDVYFTTENVLPCTPKK